MKLHRTQPAVSQSVRRLEESVGERLFDRATKDATLTDAGRLLRDYAERVLRLFEQHHIPANILVSLPSLEGIKRAVATNMGVALLPRRCAESEIERGELIALPIPEIRLRRQVRLVFRRGGERSHASAAFL